MRVRGFVASVAAAGLLLSACGGGDANGSATDAETVAEETEPDATETEAEEAAGDFGEPETTELTAVTASGDAGSFGPFITADALGHYEEEGLTVQYATVEDTRAAVVGGSAQIGVIEVPNVAEAVREGVDLVVFSGFRCREQYAIAAQSEIESAEDLAGENVNLDGSPGDPIVNFRLQLLRDAGWDLEAVDGINYVTVPGRSGAWLEVFTQGQIAMTPFYRSQTAAYEELGANIVINEFIEWPNEVLVTTREFLDANPNTLGRFLRATMQGAQYYMDTEQSKDDFLAWARERDFGVERVEADYLAGPILHCENMYVDADQLVGQLETTGFENPPSFEEMTDLSLLHRAQESLGLDNEPPTGDEIPDPSA